MAEFRYSKNPIIPEKTQETDEYLRTMLYALYWSVDFRDALGRATRSNPHSSLFHKFEFMYNSFRARINSGPSDELLGLFKDRTTNIPQYSPLEDLIGFLAVFLDLEADLDCVFSSLFKSTISDCFRCPSCGYSSNEDFDYFTHVLTITDVDLSQSLHQLLNRQTKKCSCCSSKGIECEVLKKFPNILIIEVDQSSHGVYIERVPQIIDLKRYMNEFSTEEEPYAIKRSGVYANYMPQNIEDRELEECIFNDESLPDDWDKEPLQKDKILIENSIKWKRHNCVNLDQDEQKIFLNSIYSQYELLSIGVQSWNSSYNVLGLNPLTNEWYSLKNNRMVKANSRNEDFVIKFIIYKRIEVLRSIRLFKDYNFGEFTSESDQMISLSIVFNNAQKFLTVLKSDSILKLKVLAMKLFGLQHLNHDGFRLRIYKRTTDSPDRYFYEFNSLNFCGIIPYQIVELCKTNSKGNITHTVPITTTFDLFVYDSVAEDHSIFLYTGRNNRKICIESQQTDNVCEFYSQIDRLLNIDFFDLRIFAGRFSTQLEVYKVVRGLRQCSEYLIDSRHCLRWHFKKCLDLSKVVVMFNNPLETTARTATNHKYKIFIDRNYSLRVLRDRLFHKLKISENMYKLCKPGVRIVEHTNLDLPICQLVPRYSSNSLTVHIEVIKRIDLAHIDLYLIPVDLAPANDFSCYELQEETHLFSFDLCSKISKVKESIIFKLRKMYTELNIVNITLRERARDRLYTFLRDEDYLCNYFASNTANIGVQINKDLGGEKHEVTIVYKFWQHSLKYLSASYELTIGKTITLSDLAVFFASKFNIDPEHLEISRARVLDTDSDLQNLCFITMKNNSTVVESEPLFLDFNGVFCM